MSKREVIVTLYIVAHGEEDHLHPFDKDSEIGKYYRKNVVAYNPSAVPGISALMSIYDSRYLANKIIQDFKRTPTATRELMQTFATEYRREYAAKLQKKMLEEGNVKYSQEEEYLSEASNLFVYLSNKYYHFYTYVPGDKMNELDGISVVDIRVKITHPDGSVEYNVIDFPAHSGEFNLRNRIGVESFGDVLLNKLGIGSNVTLEDMLRTLTFSSHDDEPIDRLSLENLYNFFKLMEIDYVNIFDFSCRSCITGRAMSEDEIADIGNSEFAAFRKVNAFGKRKRIKKNTKNKKKKRKGTKKGKPRK